MSRPDVKGWLAKYYPVDARNVLEQDALRHSATKWGGLLESNLAAFGLTLAPIPVSSGSCALCEWHDGDVEAFNCATCPLAISLGHRCDSRDHKNSPWFAWQDKRDPRPMIAALRQALGEEEDE